MQVLVTNDEDDVSGMETEMRRMLRFREQGEGDGKGRVCVIVCVREC